MKCDFGETRIKELEKELSQTKNLANEVVTLFVQNRQLREYWLSKFSIAIPAKLTGVSGTGGSLDTQKDAIFIGDLIE